MQNQHKITIPAIYFDIWNSIAYFIWTVPSVEIQERRPKLKTSMEREFSNWLQEQSLGGIHESKTLKKEKP